MLLKEHTKMPSRTENAYAAGLFDGEGHIAIVYRSGKGPGKYRYPRYQLRLSLSQNNRAAVDWLAAKYGGTTGFKSGKRSYDEGIYERWDWVISTAAAAAFLKLIRPYVIVKKAELKIALAFQATMMITGRAQIPENIVAFRKECHDNIRLVRGTQAVFPPEKVSAI